MTLAIHQLILLRRLLCLAAAACMMLAAAQSRAAPGAAHAPLGYDDARHLLNRVGFGATQAEILRFAPLSRGQAVNALLGDARAAATTPPPAWAAGTEPLRYPRAGQKATDAEKKMFQQEQVREGLELRGWWVGEMLATPSPLTERMTLFWHNHFVSSQQKVKLAELMYRQNVTLRAHALGNFGVLLHAMARDPAMVIYLDSVQNRKGTPNENFAREVMELFTLGEGHYGEQDVKEAARAFTGWSLDRSTGQFVFRPLLHDYGGKTVLASTGNFDGDEVLDILLAQPQTAEFITRKLWREFVSSEPDPAEVKRVARVFRDSGYDIKVALHALLVSEAFYAADNRATLVKSPVDLVVGTLRQFDMKPGQTLPFAVAAAGMGQNLFSPPNVKGWPGQNAWINSSTLLARKQFLDRLVRADDGVPPREEPAARMQPVAVDAMTPAPKQAILPTGAQDPDKIREIVFRRNMERALDRVAFDSASWFAQLGVTPQSNARSQAATRMLLATAPQIAPDPDIASAALVRALVLDVSYQLK
ncbi:MAG: DUF1800 domain-containing protein [Betaproteobacteria bacterium]